MRRTQQLGEESLKLANTSRQPSSPYVEPADRNPGRYAEKGYVDSYGYQSLCETFLRACNPFLYGEGEAKASVEQLEKLKLAVMGLQALSRALQESGKLDDKSDPVMMSMVDPRNVWAYSGKMHRPVVAIHLPLANKTIMMKQFWMQDQDFSEGGLIDGHTTGSTLWDAAVCLADFLTHPTEVLQSHHASLGRQPTKWDWTEKTVIELGAGLGLVSCTAAVLGAKKVVCTDGDGSTLRMAAQNAEALRASHPYVRPIDVKLLRWGQGEEHELGVDLPVDMVVASDVLYVLDNPGAWGAFLRTLLALSGPSTLMFLTYTERGWGKHFQKFVQRAKTSFEMVEVSPHLLHPTSLPEHADRIERTSGIVRIFCLSRKPE